VRDVAVAGLAFVEHPRARVLLLEAAQDPSSHTRVAAMRGLGQSTADSDIVAALEGALGDADAWVRYYACQALGKLGVLSAATRVAVLLADPAGQVRVAAVEALAQLKSPPALALLGTAASANDPDMRRAALIGLGMMQNAESLPVLVAACSDDEAATRMVALSALRAYASHETLLIVAKGLRDADEGVRAAAVGLVASWPLTEATQILIDALREGRDSGARAHITQALATAMHGRIAGLLKGLETSDDELAPTLISVLGRLDPSDQTGALFEALRMPNVAARKAAAAILAARGTREARAALTRRSTEDPAEEVRRVCALLLSQ
jgi:HEAT repeat protein